MTNPGYPLQGEPSEKSRGAALALAVVLGVFGAHRFYVGKVGTGALQAVTLGGFGLWYLYDCIIVGTGQFTDARGRYLSRWDPSIPEPHGSDPRLLAEVEALRGEVAELAERLDFAERLLSRPREGERA